MVRPGGPEPEQDKQSRTNQTDAQARKADPLQGGDGDVHDLMSLTAG
jgi:hypothetical protein